MFGENTLPVLRSNPNPTRVPFFYDASFRDSIDFFGLTKEEANHLFVPEFQDTYNYGGINLGDGATRKQVAKNILAFIEKKRSLLKKEVAVG